MTEGRPGVLRVSGFRRLLAASTVSRWGDTFNTVALVVLVLRLTGSGVGVAATVGFEILPVLLLGLPAGAVVDRLALRRVMIAADLGRAAVALALVVGQDRLVVVYAAAFAMSALTQLHSPATASAVPALVEPEDLVAANSALWSAAVVSQIALAPVAGALVAVAGPGPAFSLNAASFVVSALLLSGLKLPAGNAAAAGLAAAGCIRGRGLADVRAGLAAVRSSRLLSTLAGTQALAALSAGATSALLVVLADRHLGVGAARFGVLLAAIGVGAALGPLALGRLLRRTSWRRVWLFGPYLLRGVVDLVLAAFGGFAVAAAALVAYGVGTSTGNVTYQSVLQQAVPAELRGRTFAFYDVVWQSSRLASIGIGGILADWAGIRSVYVLGGVLLLAAGGLGWARLPEPPPLRPAPPE